MWDDESVPDETDDDIPAPAPPMRPVPRAIAPLACTVTRPPAPVERRLQLEPLHAESIYDFVLGSAHGAAPPAGRAGQARAVIVHKRAVREGGDTDGDEHRWDERAPRAKHEHIPQLPCRFFNTPRGCQAGADCRFAHVKPGEARGTPSAASGTGGRGRA
ncbi:hypothetical protein KFE25_007609 [Diacronema lutheri]|uniref:C3H1-type domain-containing protein n=2 Tax=Diacronema lutheri TaxID=2081491 RepID=A0A8J5XHN1_DIALT|nr:hypothetical protein KFE25_007609 [Diacronema lutheri]